MGRPRRSEFEPRSIGLATLGAIVVLVIGRLARRMR
jgi:hypothetical protein